jgi:aryl-alcohol dehydrogenase-like predicted oxidoreductase
MEYRQIPHTDLSVSVIGLGTMTYGEQNTEEEGHGQLDYALEHGVNFIDTAEMYPVPPKAETYSETERIIGTWLAARGKAVRDTFTLATKCAGPFARAPYIRGGKNRFNRKNLEEALEGSLRRLQTDHIDLYQLHWPDRPVPLFGEREFAYPEPGAVDDSVPIEETLSVLADIAKTGKVRYFGLSNETPWGTMSFLRLAEEKGYPRMVSIQNAYSLLNRTYEGGLSEITHREGIPLLPYSPLAFGKLSGKYLDGAKPAGARVTLFERFSRYNGDNSDTAIARYVTLAREHGLDPAQMALAFVNSRPFVASNIIGATTMDQLKSNIASADVTLSQEVLKAIESIHAAIPNPCP